MNRKVLKIVSALILAAMPVLAGGASPEPIVRVNVPFDFMVNGRELPAGQYTVAKVATSALVIRGEKKAVTFLTFSGKAEKGAPSARLVFRRYNNQHFLGTIWDGLSSNSIELGKSPAERKVAAEMSRHLAQSDLQPETVTVLAGAGN